MSLGGIGCKHGQVVEVSDEDGELALRHRWAEQVEGPQEQKPQTDPKKKATK